MNWILQTLNNLGCWKVATKLFWMRYLFHSRLAMFIIQNFITMTVLMTTGMIPIPYKNSSGCYWKRGEQIIADMSKCTLSMVCSQNRPANCVLDPLSKICKSFLTIIINPKSTISRTPVHIACFPILKGKDPVVALL